MGKNNISLGTLVGKIGDFVYWRTLGQQRIRAYWKRDTYHVSYELAIYQSQFANLRAIYSILPPPWREAVKSYKKGRTAYVDFMAQYKNFSQPKDRNSVGIGRLLAVPCAVSRGTLNVILNVAMESRQPRINNVGVGNAQSCLTFITKSSGSNLRTWNKISQALISEYPFLRNGDIIYFFVSWMTFFDLPWGQADAVTGFPFPYENMAYWARKIDTSDTYNVFTSNDIPFYLTDDTVNGKYRFGWCPKALYNTSNISNHYAAVGSVLVRRPGNTRTQQWSPASLVYDRSQLMLLSQAGRSTYDAFAVNSFVKEP